ncbi:MAG TPA: RNA polymerase sigma factor [Steroidobacteraceae bacterium]|jgi:RNA polymerase sigma-70 factor (ECF subfamily)
MNAKNIQSLEAATVEDITDRALLIATGAADRRAFAELYRRYADRVYSYVRNVVRDDLSAEDLVIDTMTAVWNGAAAFRGASRVSSWILGIARHKAIDAVRTHERMPVCLPIDDSSSLEATGPTPYESVFVEQRRTLARRALAMLSDEHREALFLAYYRDLPYEVIAERLNIPRNTVKSRVYCAKQCLMQKLSSLRPA